MPKPSNLRSHDRSETVFDKYYWSSTFHEIHEEYYQLVHSGTQQGESASNPTNIPSFSIIACRRRYFGCLFSPVFSCRGLLGHVREVCQGMRLHYFLKLLIHILFQIIISEKYLANDKKTIKTAKDIAGVAGGLKHVWCDCLIASKAEC